MQRFTALILLILLLLALNVPAAAQGASTIAAPALRAEVTVASDIVRIGDLVDNAGAAANVAIFRAPDLGDTGTVSVARLVEALRPHDVIGLDSRGLSEVAVTRASRAVAPAEIERRIAAALAGRYGLGEAKSITVTLDREAATVHVEPTATAELQIARLAYDPRTRRFDVSFELPGSALARRKPLRYSGVVTDMVETAVLVRPLARGEVVSAADIAVQKRPRSESPADAVRGSEAAVGLAARRPLGAGHTIRSGDLMKPELVGRNEPVTIVYQVPGILLTLRGKAVESGAAGELVGVLNMQSKRIVQGVVTGPGRVTVTTGGPRLAANIGAGTSSPATGTVRRRAE
jgi:flagella basal body P-ring formation protein FlgA